MVCSETLWTFGASGPWRSWKKSWLVSLNMLTPSLMTHSCMVHGLSLGVPGEVGPMGYHAASCIAKGAQHSALYVPTSRQCYMQCYFGHFYFVTRCNLCASQGTPRKETASKLLLLWYIMISCWYLFCYLISDISSGFWGWTWMPITPGKRKRKREPCDVTPPKTFKDTWLLEWFKHNFAHEHKTRCALQVVLFLLRFLGRLMHHRTSGRLCKHQLQLPLPLLILTLQLTMMRPGCKTVLTCFNTFSQQTF